MEMIIENSWKVEKCCLTSYKLTERETNGSEIAEEPSATVVVRNAWLEYQTCHPVLAGLNMTVNSGSIYSLLGSSGGGKTSLLLSILGMRKLSKGNIWVFGEKPVGMRNGRNVGYMPQDISLYGEFTIWETLLYFGTFNGMDQSQIALQARSLEDLLELPNLKRRVNTLSGGQQRRVSLSVALLHNPPLLILDEPTVGVDALLCQTIWNYLEKLASCMKTTIIITTHYIEEARKSHMIGVLREGRIIAEMPPQNLINTYCTEGSFSLEKAVLKLCRESSVENIDDQKYMEISIIKMAKLAQSNSDSAPNQSVKRIKALTRKNFIILLRNILMLSFVIWIPAIEVFFVALTYGYEPAHLKVGIINYEVNTSLCPDLASLADDCNLSHLSCAYLSHLEKEKVELITFETEQDAEIATRFGNIWGYLIIPPDFSANLYDRLVSGLEVNDTTLDSSQIITKLDETNTPVSIFIKIALHEALLNATSTVLSSCGFPSKAVQPSLQYGDPVSGEIGTDLGEYTSPGIAIAAMVFFPIVTIGTRFVNERKCGMLERSLVAGVQMWEIIMAYLFSESFFILMQSLLVFGVVRLMSNIAMMGSTLLCIFLLTLAGFCGVSLGFLLGLVFNEEIQVALVAMASFLPNLALCAIVWPIQGMPKILQQVVTILPCTLSSESFRSIIFRGWGISHENIWPGFLIFVLHMLAYSVSGVLFHKYKSR